MAINKVKYGNQTLIDLTDTTATADKILTGFGAYGKDGVWMDGTASTGSGAVADTITQLPNGGDHHNVYGVDLTLDTVAADKLLSGYTAHDSAGNAITGSYAPTLQSKSVTPTESQQTVTPDTGKDGLSSVTVGAISSTYVGSGITQRTSSDLTNNGNIVNVPAGYYASSRSRSLPTMSSPPAPQINISGTGLITATATANSSAWVTQGTTSTGSRQLTTKGATTYTPTTTNQTIASGTYLTGAQTISGDANLTARNIKKNVTIFGVTGTAEPSLIAKTVTPTAQTQIVLPTGTTEVLISDTLPSISSAIINSYGATKLITLKSGAVDIVTTFPNTYRLYLSTANRETLGGGTRYGNGGMYIIDEVFTMTGTAVNVPSNNPWLQDINIAPVTNGLSVTFKLDSTGTAGHDGARVYILNPDATFDASTGWSGDTDEAWRLNNLQTTTYDGLSQVTVNGDADLVASNIKKDVNIFGVTGTYEPFVEEKDANFYDYDGTLLYSYTAQQFGQLSELPPNPSHTGLTAQGWNWALSDAKEYLLTAGSINIGQMYVTDDGKTRIYIKVKNNLTPTYRVSRSAGTVTVNWGDNSEEEQVATTTNLSHTYPQAGEYIITFSGGTLSYDGSSYSYSICPNVTHAETIEKVELGTNISKIGRYMFYSCCNLQTITVPSNISGAIGSYTMYHCRKLKAFICSLNNTQISDYAFQYCYSLGTVCTNKLTYVPSGGSFDSCSSLQHINYIYGTASSYLFRGCSRLKNYHYAPWPDTVTNAVIDRYAFSRCYALQNVTLAPICSSIGQYAFQNCYCLTEIELPASVTSIGAGAFSGCDKLFIIRLLSTDPPTLSNTNALSSLPTAGRIYVPQESLGAYQTASNWSTYASRMVGE